MSATTATNIATVLATIAAVSALGFIVHYTAVANWWRTFEGRVLFSVAFSTAFLLSMAVTIRYLGPWPGYIPMAVAAYALVAATYVSLWGLLIRNRHHAKHNRRNPEGHHD